MCGEGIGSFKVMHASKRNVHGSRVCACVCLSVYVRMYDYHNKVAIKPLDRCICVL